jgi:hypothetical protein
MGSGEAMTTRAERIAAAADDYRERYRAWRLVERAGSKAHAQDRVDAHAALNQAERVLLAVARGEV